jgi:hypothetical protein
MDIPCLAWLGDEIMSCITDRTVFVLSYRSMVLVEAATRSHTFRRCGDIVLFT